MSKLLIVALATMSIFVSTSPAPSQSGSQLIDICGDSQLPLPFFAYEESYWFEAWKQWDAKNYLMAKELFKHYTEVKPREYKGFDMLGWSYKELRCNKQALIAFRQAVIIRPKEPTSRSSIIDILISDSRLDEAEQYAIESVREIPKSAITLCDLGLVYLRQDKNEEAIRVLVKAKSLKPPLPQVYIYLSVAYAKSGNKTAAIAEFHMLEKIDAKAASELEDRLRGLGVIN